MEPSEVRERVLQDHAALRSQLTDLETRIDLVAGRGAGRAHELKADAEQLLARLRTHMRWEESYLLPALRAADSWGEARAERLRSDHREQRETLDFIVARLHEPDRPAPLVLRDIGHLIDLLREDMREEEEELLDERVLRDDVIGIDVEAG